jgi:DNA-binding MarR family transcriptional regulator
VADLPDEAQLSGARLETWAALATVLEWLPPALDVQLQRDADLSHFEYGVLYALANATDRTHRMSAPAGYANGSLSRLSRAALRLETKGWVRRMPDHTDGRYTWQRSPTRGGRRSARPPPDTHTVQKLVLGPLTPADTGAGAAVA